MQSAFNRKLNAPHLFASDSLAASASNILPMSDSIRFDKEEFVKTLIDDTGKWRMNEGCIVSC